MITKDKVTKIFCIADDFCKEFDKEAAKKGLESSKEARRRHWSWSMSRSEIMTILTCFHFGPFRNFKHYYLFYVKDKRIRHNKVFKDHAVVGKGIMGWYFGFKLHFIVNGRGKS